MKICTYINEELVVLDTDETPVILVTSAKERYDIMSMLGVDNYNSYDTGITVLAKPSSLSKEQASDLAKKFLEDMRKGDKDESKDSSQR